MAVEERDPHTGYLTTGHEWNGIKELNTPVPRPVYFFLLIALSFRVGYWVLMPAWPLGVTYTKGLLGVDQRNIVQDSLKRAALGRSAWTKQIEAKSYQRDSSRSCADEHRAPDRPHPVRRQLLRLPWARRPGRPRLPEPDHHVVAVGRRPGLDRRDHPRRHQLAASRQPHLADAGLRP